MVTDIAIAPNAAKLNAAGGIELAGSDSPVTGFLVATCHLCTEWTDGKPAEMQAWASRHATEHDALRPSVLGIDPSLRRAGIAIISRHPDGCAWPSLVTHRGEDGHEGATYPERGARLVRQARAIMGVVDAARIGGADIRLTAIEGPAYGMTTGHAFDRGGLWWAIYSALTSRHIPVAVVTPAHREKFIAGVSLRHAHSTLTQAAAKQRIVEETVARWRFPAAPADSAMIASTRLNHDQADALGLADMAALHLKLGVPWRPRSRHVENVHLVEWPEVSP